MQARYVVLTLGLLVATVMAGCGGGQSLAPAPGPPDDGGPAGAVEVGPMLVRPASAAGFVAEEIPSPGDCAFVAMHGANIEYLASQALLDRVVFNGYRDGTWDVWVCNLDGSNITQITNNTAVEQGPKWSPDGSRIAFERQWPGQDREVMVVNADGSGVKALTNNTDMDGFPSWSPVALSIVFYSDREGNQEVYTMYDDGSMVTNLTNNAASDAYPSWSPDATDPDIAFSSDRDANWEIYRMENDGSNQTRLTTNAREDYLPAWDPQGAQIAWESRLAGGGDPEVFVMSATGGNPRPFSQTQYDDRRPAWSSDGNYIALNSNRAPGGGTQDIWLQMTEHPFARFRVTDHAAAELGPHLGSPTVQVERVLIGPSGSDWGGFDPIWPSAHAGVCAYNAEGYAGFVRIGIRPADVGSLEVTPYDSPGEQLVGVLVEADEVVNLREDAGRGRQAVTWYFGDPGPGAAILYFNADTGKLVSVLTVEDSAYPAAAGRPVLTQRLEGEALVVEGSFSAVFDAQGNRVAADVSAVTISAEGGVASAE